MTNDKGKDFEQAAAWKALLESIGLLVQHAPAIAAARKSFYDEYVKAGFTEAQALELCKEFLPKL